MKSYLLHELTSSDIEEILKKDPTTVVIYSLGSIEQHGPHLPLGTDMIAAQERAIRIAKETESIVCISSLAGYSPQHINFRGTISFSQETLIGIIKDTITSLYKHGFKRILIINTHNTNSPIIESTILKIKEKIDISIAFNRKYPTDFVNILNERMYLLLDIHAGKSETSIIKAIRPDLIKKESIHSLDVSNKFKYFDQIREKTNVDDIDKFLFDTLMPTKSEKISENGIYGISNIIESDADLYLKNIEKTINFYIEFIKRWKSVDV